MKSQSMIHPDKLFGRLGNRMFQMAYIYSKQLDGEIPDIYVQDYTLFNKHRDRIVDLFRGKVEVTPAVAIHVRRGDYVNNPFYVDLMQTNYYERAMAEFPGAKFMVFSDDIEYCKGNPLFFGCDFYHEDEIKDMNKMISCMGHIIANSSFSWWAAYLAPFTKKVIAPLAWYSDGKERTNIPPAWIRI